MGSISDSMVPMEQGGRERSQSSVHLGTFVPGGGDAIDVKGNAEKKVRNPCHRGCFPCIFLAIGAYYIGIIICISIN